MVFRGDLRVALFVCAGVAWCRPYGAQDWQAYLPRTVVLGFTISRPMALFFSL